jgi:drug/metabolite transporter superfamily protein YnfA
MIRTVSRVMVRRVVFFMTSLSEPVGAFVLWSGIEPALSWWLPVTLSTRRSYTRTKDGR